MKAFDYALLNQGHPVCTIQGNYVEICSINNTLVYPIVGNILFHSEKNQFDWKCDGISFPWYDLFLIDYKDLENFSYNQELKDRIKDELDTFYK